MRDHHHGIDSFLGGRALEAALRTLDDGFGGNGLPFWLSDALGLVALGGEVAEPGIYTVEALRDLPAVTQTVTYATGRGPVTDTYTGVPLHDLLADAGGVAVDPAVRNGILAHYVVATGSDGYRAAFSLGEIDPRFGGERIAVAYDDTAGRLGWLRDDGAARMVVPGDAYGGRYVSHLVDLHVAAGPEFVRGPGGPSSGFALGGAVADPATFTEADLAALDGVTLTATYTAGGTPVTDTYTGVPLWDLLSGAGILTDPAVKNDVLGFAVVATGGDGYRAVFSLGELDPGSGGERVLVAYDDTLGQLGPDGADGFARMVVPGDAAGGRYVSNLVSIEVVDIDRPYPACRDEPWG